MNAHFRSWRSPIGPINLISSGNELIGLTFEPNKNLVIKSLKVEIIQKTSEIIDESISQLEEYFLGKRKEFDLRIKQRGSEFQLSVWNELKKIPYGNSISYGEQALRLNIPMASRAVGTANGRNTISIIVPCHRVIGKSGLITGYAGGTFIKEKLLELEGIPFKALKASRS